MVHRPSRKSWVGQPSRRAPAPSRGLGARAAVPGKNHLKHDGYPRAVKLDQGISPVAPSPRHRPRRPFRERPRPRRFGPSARHASSQPHTHALIKVARSAFWVGRTRLTIWQSKRRPTDRPSADPRPGLFFIVRKSLENHHLRVCFTRAQRLLVRRLVMVMIAFAWDPSRPRTGRVPQRRHS